MGLFYFKECAWRDETVTCVYLATEQALCGEISFKSIACFQNPGAGTD